MAGSDGCHRWGGCRGPSCLVCRAGSLRLSGYGRLACRARLRCCRPATVGRLPAVARVAPAVRAESGPA
eukprot:15332557-Alexandrium_andersonii.AAC.1